MKKFNCLLILPFLVASLQATFVLIIDPVDGTIVTAGDRIEIMVFADADADEFIAQVQIFDGNTPLGLATPTGVNEYRYYFSTDIDNIGTLNLEARATDINGNVVSSSVVNLHVTPGNMPSVMIVSPTDTFTARVGIPFEVRVLASDADGSIASVRLRDINFQEEADTFDDAGFLTQGALIESTRSFNGNLMQMSSTVGEYVFTATLTNPDIVDLVAVASDNAGNQVISVPVQFTVTTGSSPTGTIVRPIGGGYSPYTLGDTIAIDITAADSDGSVATVEVYNGSALLGEATRTGNNTFRLNYTTNTVGSINLQARVTDDSGNTSVSDVETITVVTGAFPVISGIYPSRGAVFTLGDTIDIQINVYDEDGIVTSVEVYNGSALLGEATRTGNNTFRLNYTTNTVGSINLQARVTDDSGNTSVSDVETITVVTGAFPQVALGSVSGSNSITAGDNAQFYVYAADGDGFITQIQIFGNGVLLGLATPTGVDEFSYNFSIDIEDVGILRLEARATDERGNEGLSSVYDLSVFPRNPSETLDSDGDGIVDSYDAFPYIPTQDVVNEIINNPSLYDLYSRGGIQDLRTNSTILDVSNNQATIQIQMEESSDLESWTEAGDAATMVVPADTDTKFFRFKMAD